MHYRKRLKVRADKLVPYRLDLSLTKLHCNDTVLLFKRGQFTQLPDVTVEYGGFTKRVTYTLIVNEYKVVLWQNHNPISGCIEIKVFQNNRFKDYYYINLRESNAVEKIKRVIVKHLRK